MKKILFLFLTLLCLSHISAQEQQVIKLSPEKIEALFLKNNLQLIAEKLNVDIADAEIIQAKLWENPSLSISDVNLWSTSSQREGESEVIPPLFGSFGRNTEFSIELSQLIQTANKRGKLVSREKVSKEIAIQEFEEVLRGLKVELRQSINEVVFMQDYLKVLNYQKQSLDQLIQSYRKQVEQGNIAKSELLRLQSSVLEFENEINETLSELNEQQKTLKTLLCIDPFTSIEIEGVDITPQNPNEIYLSKLLETAEESRPDTKMYKLQMQYNDKSLAYEKSLRVPDITISSNYDRHGGVWGNFIGFGVSVDLPFFNRNQGGIKAAKISRDQSEFLMQQQQKTMQNEVVSAYNNYALAYKFYKGINDDSFLSELDDMLNIYTKNLLNRNISMLEYIDFMEAYKSNKETVLSARKKLAIQFEELQYTVGTEIK